jgi:LmbE family N-acetylglucosaminyl deacetylase
MADHEITSRLVRDAAFNASVPNYETKAANHHPPTERIPHLYYVDPIEGTDYHGRELPAGFLVDISKVFDTKRAMLVCHASQRNWLFKQHGIDEYLDAQERWSKKRGREAGVAFAESFNQHKGHPFPQNNLLAELLAGRA